MSSQSCKRLKLNLKPKPTPSSPNIVADNDDLLIEILLRLPIKSLLKFKSVSKRWLSLISNPQFSRRRTPFADSASGLILCTYPIPNFVDFNPNPDNIAPPRGPFETLTFAEDPLETKILQSCNGLLLFCSFSPTPNDFCKVHHYVHNPTTKQYSVLPPLKSYGGVWKVRGVCLAFDPSKSPHYKVVCVRRRGCFQYARDHLIEIYSSEGGPWRVSRYFTAPLTVDFDFGVFWNGAIHWINKWENSVYFKVDEEQVRDMPMPSMVHYDDDRIRKPRRIEYFGESRDHLHLVEIYGHRTLEFNVYEMKRDYSGWFVKYHVDLNTVSIAFPEIIREDLPRNRWNYCTFSILSVIRSKPSQQPQHVCCCVANIVMIKVKMLAIVVFGLEVVVVSLFLEQ
ncbi:F-box protein [Senna tora]|uniref:F-box protein n=1 Tax=Senna tora TaxID=362788 RepID=A0A834SWD7_9FABA|nr:F-box protein [Senna tora]